MPSTDLPAFDRPGRNTYWTRVWSEWRLGAGSPDPESGRQVALGVFNSVGRQLDDLEYAPDPAVRLPALVARSAFRALAELDHDGDGDELATVHDVRVIGHVLYAVEAVMDGDDLHYLQVQTELRRDAGATMPGS